MMISGLAIASLNTIHFTTSGQSVPPAGVNIPPTVPERVEETIPNNPESLPRLESPAPILTPLREHSCESRTESATFSHDSEVSQGD